MNKDVGSVLDLLKKELEFVSGGGYKRSPHGPFRAAYLFEDSPSCPNHSDRARPHLCQDCWLMEFVSPGLRNEQVPCRFVEIAPDVTVDSLHRRGAPAESEEALRRWALQQIRDFEQKLLYRDKMRTTVD